MWWEMSVVSWTGRAWRRPRTRSDAHSEETWRYGRGNLQYHQQRRAGNGDASERRDAAGRRDDRGRDLASRNLHPKRGEETADDHRRRETRTRIVLWKFGLRDVPHGRRQMRKE